MTYLSRYQNGEREQVWSEIVALGERVRQEHVLPDALAVAYETMARAGENARRLVSRLQSIGYEFETSDGLSVPYAPPISNAKSILDAMESETGPWPLALRAWYEVVGSVNLMGFHPDWPNDYDDPHFIYTDPLVLDPIEPMFDIWRDEVEEPGTSILPIAPDYYHKADVSGGGPYGIVLPNEAADARVAREWHDTTLVNYLRECFRWGGFPGFDVRHPMNPQHLVEGVAMPSEHFALLTSDLLPM